MRLLRVRLLVLLVAIAAPASGCAGSRKPGPEPRTPPPRRAALPAQTGSSQEPDVPDGVFHRVEAGQTLWRIARAYGVDWRVLAQVNGIGSPEGLEVGKLLFVPGAKVELDVAPFPAPLTAARPSSAPQPDAPAFAWPVAEGEVLSPFGAPRHGHLHAGVDIRGAFGQDVLASGDGEVVFSGDTHGDYGKLLILEHADGFETLYAHNSELLVQAGDRIARGQAVARVGRTGNATTDHCHFELRRNKVALDPETYVSNPRNGSGTAPAVAAGSRRPHGEAERSTASPAHAPDK